MWRSAARRLRAELWEWSGLHARARAQLDGSRAAILMYHRVLPPAVARARAVEPGMFVTPDSFARQLDWLRDAFEVLPLGDLTERLLAGAPLPPRACAISFDDGWRDNFEYALPALSARGLPATVFLVTARVGSRGAFWPDEVCRRLAALSGEEARRVVSALGAAARCEPAQAAIAQLKRLSEADRGAALARLRALTDGAVPEEPEERELLDWDEIARMAEAGVEFESHGVSHALLTGLPRDAAARELRESREALLARGHGRRALVAYPNGAHDAEVRALARAAGYRAGVTTARGLASADADPFALPRLGLHEDIAASRAAFHRVVPGSGKRP